MELWIIQSRKTYSLSQNLDPNSEGRGVSQDRYICYYFSISHATTWEYFLNFNIYSSGFLLQLKQVMDSDSALTEDLIAYNIIPLDTSSSTNAIVSLPEVSYFVWDSKFFTIQVYSFLPEKNDCSVQAAMSALKYFSGLPELPRGYFIPSSRNTNVSDFLQCIFGFQVCILWFPCCLSSRLVWFFQL